MTSSNGLRSDAWKRRTTLLACFLHFDFSFMLWVLIGALGIPLAEAAQLSAAEKGLVVAVPLLAGSLLRIVAGTLVDRVGGKRVGIVLLALLFVPLGLAWQLPPSLPMLLGSVRHTTGSFTLGFVVLAAIAAVATVSLRLLISARGRWSARVGALS